MLLHSLNHNRNHKNIIIIIEHGLAEGTPIYLNPPENIKKFTVAGNELISVIREKERTRKTEIERMNIERTMVADKLSESEALPSVLVQTGQGGQPAGL